MQYIYIYIYIFFVKVLTRRLAAQLCGIFVTVEKDAFESRLEKILSLLAKQFHFTNNFEDDQPGCFVKVQKEEVLDEDIKDPERMKAHHLYVVLQLLQNIGTNCTPFLKAKKYQDSVYGFAGNIHFNHQFINKIDIL